ncbi:hypothetical protein PMIN01_07119 [Paraphaeosphaeria minitans]|uniref:Uncharacterized protein n=1 Tax=Paraphaeosphaeria minitans TaxID=565426 RepID=A0A9P6KPX7_9PLEO|nr:hypothetical protein PMIN01_07119 [Paraphaeosphaeria minitans]
MSTISGKQPYRPVPSRTAGNPSRGDTVPAYFSPHTVSTWGDECPAATKESCVQYDMRSKDRLHETGVSLLSAALLPTLAVDLLDTYLHPEEEVDNSIPRWRHHDATDTYPWSRSLAHPRFRPPRPARVRPPSSLANAHSHATDRRDQHLAHAPNPRHRSLPQNKHRPPRRRRRGEPAIRDPVRGTLPEGAGGLTAAAVHTTTCRCGRGGSGYAADTRPPLLCSMRRGWAGRVCCGALSGPTC